MPAALYRGVQGCTAPAYDENQLHAAVVELSAAKDAEIKYSTVQNWWVVAWEAHLRPLQCNGCHMCARFAADVAPLPATMGANCCTACGHIAVPRGLKWPRLLTKLSLPAWCAGTLVTRRDGAASTTL